MNNDLLRLGICFMLYGISLEIVRVIGIEDLYMVFVFSAAIICRFKQYPRRAHCVKTMDYIDIECHRLQ